MGSFNTGLLSTFILCYLSIYGHAALEPRCSKFAYEESLLEKMVRMEFAVEKMLEGVKDVESRVKEEVNKLQSERHAFERERSEFMDKIKQVEDSVANKLQELTTDVDIRLKDLEGGAKETILNLTSETQSRFVQLKNDIDENLKYSEDVITRLSSDVWDLKNETIKEIQDFAKGPTVLFRARNLIDLSPGNNQILIFQNVLENQGNGYNNVTGIFAAPMDGVYLFSVQLCSNYEADFNFAYMENGVNKQPTQVENHAHGCGTAVYVTLIKSKTEIWIESKHSYSSNRLFTDDYRWNVFSGIHIK